MSPSHHRHPVGLLDLPVECRHAIYQYLFCHQSAPVWLSSKYSDLNCLELRGPVLYTQLFRVCKSISTDAITFAYSANKFVLCDSYPAFCRLGKLALASLKDLTVIHNGWATDIDQENQAWGIIKASCVGLNWLELDLYADMLLESVAYLAQSWMSMHPGVFHPALVLDFYVWEQHFTFDSAHRDFGHALHLLHGTHRKLTRSSKSVHFRTRILGLLTHPNVITLSADVGQGLIQAMDAFLRSNPNLSLVKEQKPLPTHGRRSCGRIARFRYSSGDATVTNVSLEGAPRVAN